MDGGNVKCVQSVVGIRTNTSHPPNTCFEYADQRMKLGGWRVPKHPYESFIALSCRLLFMKW